MAIHRIFCNYFDIKAAIKYVFSINHQLNENENKIFCRITNHYAGRKLLSIQNKADSRFPLFVTLRLENNSMTQEGKKPKEKRK